MLEKSAVMRREWRGSSRGCSIERRRRRREVEWEVIERVGHE